MIKIKWNLFSTYLKMMKNKNKIYYRNRKRKIMFTKIKIIAVQKIVYRKILKIIRFRRKIKFFYQMIKNLKLKSQKCGKQ